MSTTTHTIQEGYCIVCSETLEWITDHNLECDYLIPAHQVRAGDYLHTTSGNGMKHATIGIGSTSRNGNTITLHGAQAAYEYPADTLVTVSR